MPDPSGHRPGRGGRPAKDAQAPTTNPLSPPALNGDGPPPGATPPPLPAPRPPTGPPTRRALLRYFGGKTSLAPWIVAHLPPHRCYTEAFGGGAAVLLQKPRSPVEAARRLLVRSHMGHGGEAACGRKTGFRRLSHRRHLRGTHPALDWARFPPPLAHFADRLRGVVVEHADAAEILRRYDGPDTVHYLDPPYPKISRQSPRDHLYAHDLDDADHLALADLLHTLRGSVLISGYASPLYDRLYVGWHRLEQSAVANGGAKRREILWLSRPPDDLFS